MLGHIHICFFKMSFSTSLRMTSSFALRVPAAFLELCLVFVVGVGNKIKGCESIEVSGLDQFVVLVSSSA